VFMITVKVTAAASRISCSQSTKDNVQDHRAVHKAQELITGYLENQLHMKISKLHEFTDGCAAWYKSHHCIGDLSYCPADHGFLVQRNFSKHCMLRGQ